jgi:MFS family permease
MPELSRALRSAGLGRALRHRNYRLFFGGQSLSLIGTWLTRVAMSWLVYRLTKSSLTLGIVGFAGQIPTFLLAPFAGVWVDRWNRHRVLVLTQVLAALQSAALAYLALSNRITVLWVLLLAALQGVINAFDVPARQSFVVQMVDDRADLPNAIALNSSMVNAARLLGPSIGGVLIAAVGEGMCFAIDAVSYVAVIASLLAMRIPRAVRVPSGKRLLHELLEGFHYAAGYSPIRNVLLLLALVSFMGMPYSVLMPAIAARTLHGDAHTLGFLMAASGIGALIGTLYLASRKSVLGLGRVVVIACSCFGLGLVAFAFSRVFWLSFLILVPTGLGMMLQMSASNTILQTVVEEDKRGRVMSFFTMAFFGTVPFGSLFAGVMADRFGPANTIAIGGLACVVGAWLFYRELPAVRRVARPAYERLGILQEVQDESIPPPAA